MNAETHESYVRAHMEPKTKERAAHAEIKTPNKETRDAIAELESGKGHKSSTVKEFMAALNADD